MSQLASFREHGRDAPFSRLYMWGAAAHLSYQSARDLAIYFSSLSPQAADDGDRTLVAAGRSIYQLGLPDWILSPALRATVPTPRVFVISRDSEDFRIRI